MSELSLRLSVLCTGLALFLLALLLPAAPPSFAESTTLADPALKQATVIDRNRALAKDLGINGTHGFIVSTELVPGALDLNGLKDLIVRAGNRK